VKNRDENYQCALLVDENAPHAKAYQHFKAFLEDNYTALEAMADIEQAYHGGRSLSISDINAGLGRLLAAVKSMAENMQGMAGERYAPLQRVVEQIGTEVLADLQPLIESRKDLVLALAEITPEMVSFVGAKAANLGILSSQLDLPVPQGFVVTAEGFRTYLRENHLLDKVEKELKELDPDAQDSLSRVSERLQQAVLKANVPRELAEAITAAYAVLEEGAGENCAVAVRSSAVGEDGEVSFAGQYASVLGVDKAGLLEAYQRVLASKFGARAISYRLQHGLGDEETPMCVAVVAMVDARASGVMYSTDPSGAQPDMLTISAVWGLGEALVGGEQSPDVFHVRKKDFAILERDIAVKRKMLVMQGQGEGGGAGTSLQDVPQSLQKEPALGDARVEKLARYAVQLEEYFSFPQDIEWAMDGEERILILQARPLKVIEAQTEEKQEVDAGKHPVLLNTGKTASPGIAAGEAFLAASPDIEDVPENAILVARTTSAELARHMHRVRGLITDMGGVSSHLASVAREFGIPAIVDAKEATQHIEQGREITMDAGTTTVYAGRIQEWLDNGPAFSGRSMPGLMHKRLGAVLEKISPLNLTDPSSDDFSPENCRTIHDVIRYLHEKSITELFSLSGEAHEQRHPSVQLAADIPLRIRIIDLGGGLEEGLTDCDTISPEQIRSIPMRALWQGLTHPGLNWSSSVNFNLRNLAGLMTAGGLGELERGVGQQSYALAARDYLNLNAKFGFHFANLDVMCAEDGSQNHITFQFSGGAGSYYGKSLRVLLLSEILEKLEFRTDLKGEFLSASLKGYDAPVMQDKLDQLGRLLACSRLLDVALTDENDVGRLAEMFFNEDYDFLAGTDKDAVQGFYIREGHWGRVQEGKEVICRQEGTRIVDPVSSGLACLLGRVTGSGYHSFLESIKAYSYYPLAIAKESRLDDGSLSVAARCESGCIDMAAGLVFGLSNAGYYLVFRIDALKSNAVLFRFSKGKRRELARTEMSLEAGRWHDLRVTVRGRDIQTEVNDKTALEWRAEEPVQGFCGLWSKADSVVSFRRLALTDDNGERTFAF
jgi:pyruvate, water dikinase